MVVPSADARYKVEEESVGSKERDVATVACTWEAFQILLLILQILINQCQAPTNINEGVRIEMNLAANIRDKFKTCRSEEGGSGVEVFIKEDVGAGSMGSPEVGSREGKDVSSTVTSTALVWVSV